MSRRTIWISKP
ncbi:hypothetical protein LINPERPRIM_LOCUS9808 [Linum perenne]